MTEPGNGFPEDDPAAEFLAREQSALAGLEDEADGGPNMNGTANHVGEEQTAFGDFETLNASDTEDAVESFEMNGENEAERPVVSVPQVPREEPETIRKWREEQKIMIEKKDAEEEIKREELRKSAQKELEDWYARYKEQIEKAKITNRNAEKEYVSERDTCPKGEEWESIVKLCDFNPKASRHTKDVSRMRTILLQLKQAPPAPRP